MVLRVNPTPTNRDAEEAEATGSLCEASFGMPSQFPETPQEFRAILHAILTESGVASVTVSDHSEESGVEVYEATLPNDRTLVITVRRPTAVIDDAVATLADGSPEDIESGPLGESPETTCFTEVLDRDQVPEALHGTNIELEASFSIRDLRDVIRTALSAL